MSVVDRKTAFLNVLARKLDKKVCDEVMAFWEEKYSNRPQFGISAFLDELYSKYSIDIKKGQLFRELSRAVMTADSRDGSSSPNSTISSSKSEKVDQSGVIVFKTLQDSFYNLAKPVDRLKISSAQMQGLKEQKGSNQRNVNQMLDWLKSGDTAMPTEMELDVLRKTFNLAYVECCQLYGPVKADQMLNAALQKTNDIPEAHIMPPVNFI